MLGGLVSVQGVSQQRGEVLRLYEGLRSLQRGQHPYEGSHVCTRGPTSERRGVVLIRSFIKSAWGGGTSTGSVGTSAWGCRIHPRGAPSSIPGVSPPSWGSPLHPGGVHLVPHHLSPPLQDCQELTDVEQAIETVINQFHCYAVKGQKEYLTPNEMRELVVQKLPHLGKVRAEPGDSEGGPGGRGTPHPHHPPDAFSARPAVRRTAG